MLDKGSSAFYLSATAAIVGTIGYHMLMKKVPSTINPVVSLLGIYVAIIAISALFLPFVMGNGTLLESLRQMTWIQAGVAVCIILMEIGFLLMYRSGWDLSTGNVVTGAIVNIALVVVGVLMLRENLSLMNVLGIILCVVGVFLIGYKGAAQDPTAAINGVNAPLQAPLLIKEGPPAGE